MKSYLPLVVLLALSLIIWIYLIIYFKSRNKNIAVYFRQLAEKYGFQLEESNKAGSIIYSLLKGVYKNRQIGIGCYFNKEGKKKQVSTYVRAECSNHNSIAFEVVQRMKNNPVSQGSIVNMMDSEFD